MSNNDSNPSNGFAAFGNFGTPKTEQEPEQTATNSGFNFSNPWGNNGDTQTQDTQSSWCNFDNKQESTQDFGGWAAPATSNEQDNNGWWSAGFDTNQNSSTKEETQDIEKVPESIDLKVEPITEEKPDTKAEESNEDEDFDDFVEPENSPDHKNDESQPSKEPVVEEGKAEIIENVQDENTQSKKGIDEHSPNPVDAQPSPPPPDDQDDSFDDFADPENDKPESEEKAESENEEEESVPQITDNNDSSDKDDERQPEESKEESQVQGMYQILFCVKDNLHL